MPNLIPLFWHSFKYIPHWWNQSGSDLSSPISPMNMIQTANPHSIHSWLMSPCSASYINLQNSWPLMWTLGVYITRLDTVNPNQSYCQPSICMLIHSPVHILHCTISTHCNMTPYWSHQILGSLQWNYHSNTPLPFVVWSSNWSECLLSCSVPNLDFDGFVIMFVDLWTKFNTNSGVMLIPELFLSVTQQDTWFTHTGIPHYDELEQVMIQVHIN